MKCPICGKDLELQKKQIGTDENGDPVFNQYAICRDCKKQWNLDKQRAKKAAARKATEAKSTVSPKPVSKNASEGKAVSKANSKEDKPVKAAQPQSKSSQKKPVKKRPVSPDAERPGEGQRYANIPPEKVRTKHEKAARQNYEDMLAADPGRKPVKRKKTDDATKTVTRTAPAKSKPASRKLDSLESDDIRTAQKKSSAKHNATVNAARKKPQPKIEEPDDYYDDDYDYDDTPRFRGVRIILGILSLLGFAFFIYKGFVAGLDSVSSGSGSSAGTTYIILALCMLVSAMLYLIMQKKNTIFAFLLPMIFYLGSAVFAFLKKGDGLELLIAAVVSAVLAVISLILGILSRGGDDYEDDDYDDPFEDDYED